MLYYQDFFHPVINGKLYFDKPLFSYWPIAALGAVFGTVNEWMARLPSAVAGLFILWCLIRLGKILWSEKVAYTAGWLLLGSYGFLFWARQGQADIGNVAMIMASVTWFFARKDKPGFITYLVFWLICFAGAQIKGPEALVLPLLILFPFLLREKQWLKHLRLSNFLAMFLGFGIYLVPYLLASHLPLPGGCTVPEGNLSGIDLVIRENITRFINPFDHKDPVYSYFYHVPRLMLPFSLFGVLAVVAALKNYPKSDANTKWLTAATVLVFLFFTASGSRRWYYILPALPFLMLEISLFLNEEWEPRWRLLVVKAMKFICLLAVLMELISPLVMDLLERRYAMVFPPLLKYGGIPAGVLGLLPFAVAQRRPIGMMQNSWGAVVLSLALLMGMFFAFQQPQTEVFRTRKAFAASLRQLADSRSWTADDMALFDCKVNDVVFYLDYTDPIPTIDIEEGLEEGLKALLRQRTGPVALIVRNKSLPFLSAMLVRGQVPPAILKQALSPVASLRAVRKQLQVCWVGPDDVFGAGEEKPLKQVGGE
ncbi:MAG: glycosyltransferase family 39 protein [Kiritimatiellales bacterium]|nr:glycosyltransferase family 39 protein [Kiritimatiellales bacterium]